MKSVILIQAHGVMNDRLKIEVDTFNRNITLVQCGKLKQHMMILTSFWKC